MSAKDIHQNLYAWDVAGVNISDTPAGKFLLTSGETFFSGHRQVGLCSCARTKVPVYRMQSQTKFRSETARLAFRLTKMQSQGRSSSVGTRLNKLLKFKL